HRAVEFLEEGDRIKVTVRFRGRELSHPELGRLLLARFAELVKEHGIIERTPVLEGKSMFIVLASTHKPKFTDAPQRPARPDGGPGLDDGPSPAPQAAPVPAAATPAETAAVAEPAPDAKPPAARATATAIPTNGAEAPQTASPSGD